MNFVILRVDEDEFIVNSSTIHFFVMNGEDAVCSGTLYINSKAGDSDPQRLYTASLVGTGLHLSQSTEFESAVISERIPDSNQE